MRAQKARWVWVREKAGLGCLLPGGLVLPFVVLVVEAEGAIGGQLTDAP